jgi:hypothetical protein
VSAHTPGPWHVREWDRHEVDVLGMGARIANVSAWADHDHTIADARLIAAAPDLLIALRMILPLAEAYMKGAPTHADNAKLEDARAALVKAARG